jgi:hypothetical protein
MKVKCFIRDREAISEFCEASGVSPIQAEYEYEKSEILGVVCVFDAEMTAEQKKALENSLLRRSRATAPLAP